MTNRMWGGRFEEQPDSIMLEINASIGFDQALYKHDIAGSIAHISMLAAQNIVTSDDARKIRGGLEQIEREIEAGTLELSAELEDIHMNIESRLAEIIGPAAGRLHTARSRNDQVATDFRLWVREALDHLDGQFTRLMATLSRRAEEHAGSIMPGFTHLQPAQPVTLGHHLLAYVEMFARDRTRLSDARARMNECPLGAAALAGTSFAIDRTATAKELGFDRPSANSLDAVSDRDFAIEALSGAAIAAMHLSRLAEEIIIWSSPAFGFISLSDRFSTGSSIMPQKRNPDAAELVRAKSGRIYGSLHSLLVMMKGLALAYSKDMQEDKEPVFDAMQSLSLALEAMRGMVEDMAIDRKAMRRSAALGYATATDLADWLVRVVDLPFREAHRVTGQIVALAAGENKPIHRLSLSDMQAVDSRITNDIYSVLSVEKSVRSRVSYGGTSPANVRRQARLWQKKLPNTEATP